MESTAPVDNFNHSLANQQLSVFTSTIGLYLLIYNNFHKVIHSKNCFLAVILLKWQSVCKSGLQAVDCKNRKTAALRPCPDNEGIKLLIYVRHKKTSKSSLTFRG